MFQSASVPEIATKSPPLVSPIVYNVCRRAPEGYIRASDLARKLGVSSASLRDWSSRGLFPNYRVIGKTAFYAISEVREYFMAVGAVVEI